MSEATSDLRRRIDLLPRGARRRFHRRVTGIERIDDAGRRAEATAKLTRAIAEVEDRMKRRRAAVPKRITYPAELPITLWREELLEVIRDHQVVIIAGETGSGKSTQIPKLCLELGRGVEGTIGHTQPRRIAARSIADRIAEEIGTRVGDAVGYAVRFSDQTGDSTLVKVMTDGLLLAEIHRDRRLERYDTIIIDEAHERSLNIDFLLGYLKTLLPRRPDLKVIITSATIDTERFSHHFEDAPVVEITGRTYPVEVRYQPLDDPDRPESRDQTQGICDAVEDLFTEGNGDILVFCSGEREIRDAADALADMALPFTEILPLYARLSAAEQHRVFTPHTGRRVVVATNVAETSLTVPGIRYVVDVGTARISRYSRRTKVQRLPIEPISQASANQRAGRCGRLGPGICIRLYEEDGFDARPDFTEPEIQRTNLASVILQMAARDLGDIETFPFLDPPDARSIRDGVARLVELGAIEGTLRDGRPRLTRLGRQLADLPIDLRLARMIIEANRTACLREVLVITTALAIQDPRERPAEKQAQADQLHARFRDDESDLYAWLNLWEYLGDERKARTSNQFRRMCRKEYLNYRRVREWQDLHAQLRDVTRELGFTLNRRPAERENVHRTVLTGLLSNVGRKDPGSHEYRGARGSRFSINPGSTLFKASPEWLMAAELVETSRLWARGVVAVQPEWIEEAATHLVTRSYSDPWWEADRGAAYAHETVTLYGLPLQADRPVLYGRVDPEGARELFIRHALVAGEWETIHRFVEHNAGVIDEVLALEAKYRRADLFVDDETIVDFFDERIPDDVISVRHFDRWWKEARIEDPHQLDLSIDDLLDPEAQTPGEDAFPEIWQYGDVAMPLAYEFDPVSESDGVTIDIPIEGLSRIDPEIFDRHVPGLREELVIAMMRGLPKQIRKRLSPIPETARSVLEGFDPEADRFVPFLRGELTRRSGVPIPPDAFDPEHLPAFLRPMFRIIDPEGVILAEGGDLGVLKSEFRDEARAAMAASHHGIERTGMRSWEIDDLPYSVEIDGPGRTVTAYPALVDEGDSVAVHLFATPAEQDAAMWEGTRRLIMLNLPSPSRHLRPLVTGDGQRAIAVGPHGSFGAWAEDCLACSVDELLSDAGGPVWSRQAFERLLAITREDTEEGLVAVASDALEILDEVRTVRAAMDDLVGDRYTPAVADMEEQIGRLLYPGFLTSVGIDRLPDLIRFVQAIGRRIEQLPDHVDRDRERMERVQDLEEERDDLSDAMPGSDELIEVAWMLQELRVSLFAQGIGTKGKVSEKRVVEAMERAVAP
ncbi:MAG: ATP-dependent RNA helicase HrpA [Actinomycetota bacterium]|nr:ATP-dependent RNA helicase HrpA [Actinomycetota bacterium]